MSSDHSASAVSDDVSNVAATVASMIQTGDVPSLPVPSATSGDVPAQVEDPASHQETKEVPQKASITKIYTAIRQFVHSLKEVNPSDRGVGLWAALLVEDPTEQTRNKCVTEFQTWFYQNTEAIKAKNADALTRKNIQYPRTRKVTMNIFQLIKGSNADAIWAHLTYILSLIDPDEEVLKMVQDLKDSSGVESNFLQNLVGNLVTEMNSSDDQDPSQMLSRMATGGTLTNVIGQIKRGMENGEMDPKQMMKQLGHVFTSLGSQ